MVVIGSVGTLEVTQHWGLSRHGHLPDGIVKAAGAHLGLAVAMINEWKKLFPYRGISEITVQDPISDQGLCHRTAGLIGWRNLLLVTERQIELARRLGAVEGAAVQAQLPGPCL